MHHIPVLLSPVLELLDIKPGDIVMDVTVGLGGHAKAFTERMGKRGRFIGVDADADNLAVAREKLQSANCKTEFVRENFRNIADLNFPRCDVIFADLGLSSPHIDDPRRGFSFRGNGPLDCRFDKSRGIAASELLEKSSERELAAIFNEYAEIEKANQLAHAICEDGNIVTAQDIVATVEKVYGWKAKKVLPRIFQALRIAVNDEMGALDAFLEYSPSLLKPGGRMGVISYHSLEDRKIKQRFRRLTISTQDSITGIGICPASYALLTKKAIKASLGDIGLNPRSRSARLRAIRKLV